MQSLRALYVEDTSDNYKFYSNYIKRLPTLAGLSLTIDHSDNVDDALELLKLSPLPYQLVIADLLFQQPGKVGLAARGLEVIRASVRLKTPLVVALTIGDTREFPNLERDSKDAGAHVFRFHSQLNIEGEWDRFGEELYSALLDQNIVADNTHLLFDENDARLLYIVSEVGSTTLKRLYCELFPKAERPQEITASYVVPGLSGAFVIHCEGRRRNDLNQNHLLKLNKTRELLAREVRRRPVGAYRGGLFVEYLTPEKGIPEHKGWFAIGAVFERGARTLREWLGTRPRRKAVENVMHQLFLDDGLASGYVLDLTEDSQGVGKALAMSLSRKARVLIAIKELGEYARSLSSNGAWKDISSALNMFIRKERFQSLDFGELVESAVLCRCHRDLHAGNILIRATRSPTVVVIDTAEIDDAHWATDYVRLAVDIIMSVYDRGVESYKGDRMRLWLTICEAVLMWKDVPEESGVNQGAVMALQWMIANLQNVFRFVTAAEKAKWHFEWCCAIAIESLRASYRIDLPPPKRILGLFAGYHALATAEKERPI